MHILIFSVVTTFISAMLIVGLVSVAAYYECNKIDGYMEIDFTGVNCLVQRD